MKFSQNSTILHSGAICVAVSFGKLLVLLNFETTCHVTVVSRRSGFFLSSGFQTPMLHVFSIAEGGFCFFHTPIQGWNFRFGITTSQPLDAEATKHGRF